MSEDAADGPHGRRWGFRARLTALIAGVFILGGLVLLTVQYLLVQRLFATGIGTISTGCADDAWMGRAGGGAFPSAVDIAVLCAEVSDLGGEIGFSGGGSVSSVLVAQTSHLSQEVLSGLLVWSLVVLAVFAALAVVAARWLSTRSLDRIARITRATREITRDDLHRRLALPGPADEVKELGDTIDVMLDRLEEAFTRQERFVAAASHELRTPLTTTRAALEIPLEQGRFPADVEPEVCRALAANRRSERLIAALLTLARTGHAAATAEEATADLAGLVRDALDEHTAEVEARGLRIRIVPGRGAEEHAGEPGLSADLDRQSGPAIAAGSVRAAGPLLAAESLPAAGPAPAIGPALAIGPVLAAVDPTLAGIAVGNLIENAIRHNCDGGEVRAILLREGGDVAVRIENDGRVLTPDEAARLTEPFHRGDQTRLTGPGTGLGLTLADTVARSLGGTLSVAPRPGGGLVVRLTLPAG